MSEKDPFRDALVDRYSKLRAGNYGGLSKHDTEVQMGLCRHLFSRATDGEDITKAADELDRDEPLGIRPELAVEDPGAKTWNVINVAGRPLYPHPLDRKTAEKYAHCWNQCAEATGKPYTAVQTVHPVVDAEPLTKAEKDRRKPGIRFVLNRYLPSIPGHVTAELQKILDRP